jgi:uncharacterized coiled-coil DUF342 family protein
MDEQALREKRSAIEQRFNALQQQIQNENQELLKLSGEHRALTELIDGYEKEISEPSVAKFNGMDVFDTTVTNDEEPKEEPDNGE